MTATLYNIEHYRARQRVGARQLFVKGDLLMLKKTGTDGGSYTQGPAVDGVAAGPFKNDADAISPKHSTQLPPIRIGPPTKRLIEEGRYEAVCVKAFYRLNQYGRYEAILDFAFDAPVPSGIPIPMHVNMGKGEPVLPEDHWLYRLMKRFGGLEKLKGYRFIVNVETIKKHPHDKGERPESEWYSRVKRCVWIDDYILASKKSL
jgi:hypothetical protein